GALYRLSPAPFGPLALRSPRWVMEGYATLVEGALTGSGRPHSTFRAMVLRSLGAAGKLPDYSALDASRSWLGASAADLIGSAFLEWLAAREKPDALPRLWERMASSAGGTFDGAFRAVFGDAPETLYDRFRAETTAAAIEEEKRGKADGLVAGELWARRRGGTLALSGSPDGRHLMARRDPSPPGAYVAIWSAGGGPAPQGAGRARQRLRARTRGGSRRRGGRSGGFRARTASPRPTRAGCRMGARCSSPVGLPMRRGGSDGTCTAGTTRRAASCA